MQKAVLFDLDGTLVDSSEGITKSVQYALKHFGIEEPDLDKLRVFIGPPLAPSFMKYYGLSEQQAKDAIPVYRERYQPIGLLECKLYPGVKECLATLKEQGYRIGVASSKPEEFCRKILTNLGAIEYFDDVVGSTFDGRISSKEQVLNEVMRRWKDINKSAMCLIGDTIFDIEGANLVQIPSIGVSFGFGNVEEMIAEGANCICDDMKDLPELINHLYTYQSLCFIMTFSLSFFKYGIIKKKMNKKGKGLS